MASGFDGLVERLLYDVALAGTGGLGIQELGDAVREFYSTQSGSKEPPQHPDDEDSLFLSETPPDNGPIIDESFVELVWQWVSRNPEVTVEGTPQPLDATAESAVDGDEPQISAGSKLDKYRKQRICTGEDRVWYAIAGHGIDYKRIPPLEFQALSVIAAQGTKGVLQPDVTKLTGQDKRSLPKRTDNLAKNGYIVKTIVIARGTKTSLLKLKKFAGDVDVPEDEGAAPGAVIIQYNLWFDEVMRLLRENDNIMAFEDIRIGLGINGKRFETRALHRCVRRLANVGCLRKITARVEAPADQPDADMKSVRSLHLVREPTEIDRVAFMRSDWQRSKLLDPAQVAQFAASGTNDDEDDDDDDDDDDEAEAIARLDGVTDDPKRYLNRSPPLWNPDLPFPNYLYNRIEEAGIVGTSSSELYDDSVGQFWKRAMDEMLVKLTDLWQFSQPPHLRHFSIVKDTGQRGKQPTFQYRTYENFEKAVEIGDTYWEGVFGSEENEKGKGKASKKKALAAASAQPELDAWGFPKANPKLFVGQNGCATLEECRRNAKPGFQAVSNITTPGSMLYRRVYTTKTPGSGSGRPKKLQTAEHTPTNRTQHDPPQSILKSVQRPSITTSPRKPSAKATAALKRTAVQANLDNEENDHEINETPLAVQNPLNAISTSGRKRPRKSLTGVLSPSMSATQDVRTTQMAQLDGSPILKKRGRPTKAMLAERERVPKDAEELRLVEKAQEPQVEDYDSPDDFEDPPVGPPVDPPVDLSVDPSVDPSVDLPGDPPKPAPVVDVKTAIEINPLGAFELKKRTLQSRGRPPKAMIAVFRSSRLRELSWYVRETSQPATKHRTPKATVSQSQKKAIVNPATPQRAGRNDSAPHESQTPSPIRPTIVDVDDSKPHIDNETPGGPPQPSSPVELAALMRDVRQIVEDQATPAPDNLIVDPAIDDQLPVDAAGVPLPDVTVESTGDPSGPRQYKKAGVTKNIGALHIKRRKVAMDIIQTCGGVFPGKGEMWYPFVTVWQRDYKQTPDRHTVDNVMKGLISSGKLKKLTFFFKSRKGLAVERSIFVEPEIDPNSPKVKLLQKRIIDNYPATVLPEEADISPEFRRQAARNPQATQNAKFARAATGEVPTPAPTQQTESEEVPPHYIRDEFPEDKTLTVRRTANGLGLGAIDAQLQSIKQIRKLANLKRGGRPRKLFPVDPEWEDGDAELTYEQALLQSEQQLPSYVRSGANKRSITRLRGSGIGGRKLPGRILGSKTARKAQNGSRTTGSQTKRSLPWDAIGYVASQAAHSYVEPNWMADTFKMALAPKRIDRIQWKWVDPSLADWRVEPSGGMSDAEDVETQNNESASFGLLLPNDTHVVDSTGLNEHADVQLVPQNLGDIVNSHMLPSSPEAESEDNEATKFFNEVERVQAWEQHVVKAKQALARGVDHPFINHTAPADIPWSLQQTPRNLAGKRLRITDDDETPKSKRRRQTQVRAAARAQTKVISENDPRKYKKRDRKAAANFGDRDHDRLAKAVALVSVVAGGLSYRRNWMIVSHAFGYQFESEFLRHRWDKVRDLRDALVKQMQAQIWEPFLDAYERGTLPNIDFDDLEGTDWPALMDWLENDVLTSSAVDYTKPAAIMNKLPDLPKTSAELQSNFLVTETTANYNASRGDEFFTAIVDKRRKDVATTYLNGLPLESCNDPKDPEETNDLLRSWARAVVLTEEGSYNSDEAYKKITKFGDKVLDSTIRDLCAEKILQVKKKGRRLPGRNLKLDEAAFLSMFKRWSDKQGPEHLFLTRVAKRRADVLNVLQYQDHYDLDYSAEDELYVVLTNMVGQGLLKVKSKIPERNDDFDAPFPKISAWGYSGYNYNVRTFDKNRLRFAIVYEKTDKFTFEHGLRNDVPIPIHPPHYANEDGYRIPLWVDIHEQLLPRMWEMAFRSVLNLVVFRPGLNAADIEEAHKGKIWSWEVELMMQWMEATGVAERTGPGEEVDGLWKGGWKVGEWWYCALCPDVAKWPALE